MIWDKKKDYSSEKPFDVELSGGFGTLAYIKEGKKSWITILESETKDDEVEEFIGVMYGVNLVDELIASETDFNGQIKVG